MHYIIEKAYVCNLTQAINGELREEGSKVYVGTLCPGPVNTEFNKVAKCNFNINGMNSYEVSNYAIKKMFANKMIIIPGIKMKLGVFALRLLPRKLILKISYKIQDGKKA